MKTAFNIVFIKDGSPSKKRKNEEWSQMIHAVFTKAERGGHKDAAPILENSGILSDCFAKLN